MKDVFFKKITLSQLTEDPQIIVDILKYAKLYNNIKKNDFVGIKIHFGEKGNKSFINPKILKPLVKTLKDIPAKPFFFDTNTLYRGERTNAIDHINLARNHGFLSLNIPLLIGDGIKGNDYIEVTINKHHYNKCFLGAIWKDTDFIFSASHFTMHMLTGFGASIKNMGMGLASRRGKLAQHCEMSPRINTKDCILCGNCAKICPSSAIVKEDSHYKIIDNLCVGCAQCISACPQGAVKINWSEKNRLLQERMVEYAYAATSGKRCAYMNFCVFITKECDCMNKENKGFVNDLGILFGYDPVAVDKASVDLLIQQEGNDIIEKQHPNTDYNHQFAYAKKIGLGDPDYKIIDFN
mgnify:CR=1 FL=1